MHFPIHCHHSKNQSWSWSLSWSLCWSLNWSSHCYQCQAWLGQAPTKCQQTTNKTPEWLQTGRNMAQNSCFCITAIMQTTLINCMIASVRLKSLKHISIILSLQLWCMDISQIQPHHTLKQQLGELETHRWRSPVLHHKVQCCSCDNLELWLDCWCDNVGTEGSWWQHWDWTEFSWH